MVVKWLILFGQHVVNKKAAAYIVVNNAGIEAYRDGVPQRRNPEEHGDIDAESRLNKLVIDRPSCIVCFKKIENFDNSTPNAADAQGNIIKYPKYPVRFPADVNDELFEPDGPLNSLGHMRR